jgi:rhodanese-related sulfurtransferase
MRIRSIPRSITVQIVLMIVAAAAIAVIANGFASRERRLVLPGYYPDARKVPPRESESVPPPAIAQTATQTTTTSEAVPAAATAVPGTTEVAAPLQTTTTTTTSGGPAIPPVPSPSPKSTPGNKTAEDTRNHPSSTPPPAVNVLARFAAHPDKAYIEISGEDATALHAAGVLFLDARRTSVYEEGHVPGSRSFSVWEADIDDKVNGLFNERSDPRDQNLPIVVYCSGGACEDSHMLAQKLWGIQFNNVYVYKDGFPDWQKRGNAVKTGANP